MLISLLHSSSPTDRVWYLFWCLLNVDVTAVFSPLLQRVRDLSESLDIFRMLIWLLPSPLLQRVRDLIWRLQNVDLTAAFSPPAESTWSPFVPTECRSDCWLFSPPAECMWCLVMFAECRFDSWVLPLPAGCTWSLLMSTECGSDCWVFPFLQGVRDLF